LQAPGHGRARTAPAPVPGCTLMPRKAGDHPSRRHWLTTWLPITEETHCNLLPYDAV